MRSFLLVLSLLAVACSSDPEPPTGPITSREAAHDLGVLYCDNEMACGRVTTDDYGQCVANYVTVWCDGIDCEALIEGDALSIVIDYYNCYLGWREYTCGQEPECFTTIAE